MDAQQWKTLSRAEKLEARFAEWAAPQVSFATVEAERAYQERAQMFKDAIQLKKPVRVPIYLTAGILPFRLTGLTTEQGMYDYDTLGQAYRKFNEDYRADAVVTCRSIGAGPMFEALDYKLYHWPGHGVPATASYQALEGEFMRADEYDLLISDPSNYFMRTYLPRVFGSLAPWQTLGALTDVIELPFTGGYMAKVGAPAVQQAFEKFLEAGREALKWGQAAMAIDGYAISQLGMVPFVAGGTKAPFDTLGDTMRGTRAIIMDKFRQPNKILAAVERLTPLNIEVGVRHATNNRGPFIFIPLHKGADGFLSDADFKKFYWPSLKAVIIGLVNEGIVPYLFVEGSYSQRLDVIAGDPDIPAGTTFWLFDRTDLKEVKKRFGGWACIGGNVPASLLATATAQEVESCVKGLIDEVAGDGGYVLAPGAVVDHARPENMRAMIDTCHRYGIY